jgi:ectoine hydroxylase-related dioxygenase (phytanoyl-CoA dioxygenase family)
LEVLQHLLSGDVVVHPRKIARMSFPGLRFPTPPHQDALFNQVATDVLTAWVPLGDCRASSGGLRVLAGSAAWGVLKARADEGLGGESVDVPLDDPRWVEGDYRCGDVILFHSRTVHMAPANRGQSLRLSVDFRYQSTLEPVTAAMLSPHGHAAGQLPGWRELTEGWSSVKWVETGHPVRVVAVAPPSLPPSRLIHARLRDGAGSGATG